MPRNALPCVTSLRIAPPLNATAGPSGPASPGRFRRPRDAGNGVTPQRHAPHSAAPLGIAPLHVSTQLNGPGFGRGISIREPRMNKPVFQMSSDTRLLYQRLVKA